VSIQQLKAVHEKTHPARLPTFVPGLGGTPSRALDLDPAGGAKSAAADA
jgi:hypothetical protein